MYVYVSISLHLFKCYFLPDDFNKSSLLLRSFKSTVPPPPVLLLVGLTSPVERDVRGCREVINSIINHINVQVKSRKTNLSRAYRLQGKKGKNSNKCSINKQRRLVMIVVE